MDQLKACSLCGAKTEVAGMSLYVYRTCNRLETRTNRVMANIDEAAPQVAKDCRSQTKEARQEFDKDAHEKFGRDLALQIYKSTAEARTKRVARSMSATGHLKDKVFA